METLNNYLNVLGCGSLGFFAEKQSVAEKPICAPFRWREHGPIFPPKRYDPCSLEFDLTNFSYIETSAMPRRVSFEERKVISVLRACGTEVLGEAGSSDARLRGVPSTKSHAPSPEMGLWQLPKSEAEPCSSLSSRREESSTREPLLAFSRFLCRGCQGTLK